MATVLFTTMFPEVAPHVPGVPDAVMEAYIRKVTIDLCTRAKVWRVPLNTISVVSPTYQYTVSSPVAGTEPVCITRAQLYRTTANATDPLDILSAEEVFQQYPRYPDANDMKKPYAIECPTPETVNLLPVPDTADTYTVKLFGAIRPTLTSTGCEAFILNDFRRAVFHGTLHELMVMPDRKWSDEKTSLYHGKQWEYYLYQAKARANKSFGPADVQVQQRPWA